MTAASRKPVEEKLDTTASPKTKICWPWFCCWISTWPSSLPKKRTPRWKSGTFFLKGERRREMQCHLVGSAIRSQPEHGRQTRKKKRKKTQKTGGRQCWKVSERAGRGCLLRARESVVSVNVSGRSAWPVACPRSVWLVVGSWARGLERLDHSLCSASSQLGFSPGWAACCGPGCCRSVWGQSCKPGIAASE